MILSPNYFVIDNFYKDAHAVRSAALSAEYQSVSSDANFPGRESVKSYFTRQHKERFEKATGRPLVTNPDLIYGRFRLAQEKEFGRSNVHIDIADWTAVIYLSPVADDHSGVVFYRHLELNLSTVPDLTELQTMGFNSVEDFDRRVVAPDSTRSEAWQPIDSVGFCFNRCVIFKGSKLFHGVGKLFGQNKGNARLTHNFFLMNL